MATRIALFAVPILLLAFAPWWLLLASVVVFVLFVAFTRRGHQIWSVTQIGLATIPQRLGSSSVVVVGIAGVVAVLVALLAMAQGFAETLKQTGGDDTAIVIRAGARTELNSVLDHDTAVLVSQSPQVMHDPSGQPIASPELVVVASLPKKSTGLDANVEVRGIGDRAWVLRPKVQITAGRKFKPGLRELIVGKDARRQFANVEPGASIKLNSQVWTVVGAFDSGDAYNSELWGDTDIVASTYRRGSSTTSVTVRLTSAGAFDAFNAGLQADRRLQVDASTTRAYYNAQSETISTIIRVVGITVAIIMAIGAVFGALNTMYAAVAARTREIATLRAIGFRGTPVVISVLGETVALALFGGILGAGLAWAVFDNYTASTLGSNFSQVVFAFKVSPALLWQGLKWALLIGLIGGLFPALRAASQPVTTGLREL
ncbi:MAG TPA: ABC transporter permease [Steroidobacteraceae bacterium]|jgi:putative ABC transport system permease protein